MSIETQPHEPIHRALSSNSMSQSVTTISSINRSGAASARRAGVWLRWFILVLVASALLIGGTVYTRGGLTAQKSGPKLTHRIARGSLIVSVTEEGSLESSSNKEIKCRVKGGSTVLWIIKPGTQVKPGDVLVRLDTATIEDNINAQRIKHQNALAAFAQSESDAEVAKINVQEYLEGTYRADKQTLQKDIKIAESSHLAAQDSTNYARRMAKKGYFNQTALLSSEDAEEHSKLELEVLQTKLDVLDRYGKVKSVLELDGILKAKVARLASDKAALDLEKDRLDRIEEQLKHCQIEAESSGMVILPTPEQWKNQPNIEEGAAVREDQVLLMIPDLDQMQVKLGVHEAYVSRLKPGMQARVQLQEEFVDGEILSIASVTRPAGWWNGNQVKYDTVIKLKSQEGLKPGMSASVEVLLARHDDVVTTPVAAVVEQDGQFFCWVRDGDKTPRRKLDLGDSNDQFIVIKGGLSEGEDVVLNPREYIKAAQTDALKPAERDRVGKSNPELAKPAK